MAGKRYFSKMGQYTGLAHPLTRFLTHIESNQYSIKIEGEPPLSKLGDPMYLEDGGGGRLSDTFEGEHFINAPRKVTGAVRGGYNHNAYIKSFDDPPPPEDDPVVIVKPVKEIDIRAILIDGEGTELAKESDYNDAYSIIAENPTQTVALRTTVTILTASNPGYEYSELILTLDVSGTATTLDYSIPEEGIATVINSKSTSFIRRRNIIQDVLYVYENNKLHILLSAYVLKTEQGQITFDIPFTIKENDANDIWQSLIFTPIYPEASTIITQWNSYSAIILYIKNIKVLDPGDNVPTNPDYPDEDVIVITDPPPPTPPADPEPPFNPETPTPPEDPDPPFVPETPESPTPPADPEPPFDPETPEPPTPEDPEPPFNPEEPEPPTPPADPEPPFDPETPEPPTPEDPEPPFDPETPEPPTPPADPDPPFDPETPEPPTPPEDPEPPEPPTPPEDPTPEDPEPPEDPTPEPPTPPEDPTPETPEIPEDDWWFWLIWWWIFWKPLIEDDTQDPTSDDYWILWFLIFWWWFIWWVTVEEPDGTIYIIFIIFVWILILWIYIIWWFVYFTIDTSVDNPFPPNFQPDIEPPGYYEDDEIPDPGVYAPFPEEYIPPLEEGEEEEDPDTYELGTGVTVSLKFVSPNLEDQGVETLNMSPDTKPSYIAQVKITMRGFMSQAFDVNLAWGGDAVYAGDYILNNTLFTNESLNTGKVLNAEARTTTLGSALTLSNIITESDIEGLIESGGEELVEQVGAPAIGTTIHFPRNFWYSEEEVKRYSGYVDLETWNAFNKQSRVIDVNIPLEINDSDAGA